MAKINQARAAAGLTADGVLPGLRDGCRRHANEMAARREAFHSTFGEETTAAYDRMAWVGENVGAGYDASLHDAFMASPGHRENILEDHQYVGVGVVKRSDGVIYVCERFMRSDPRNQYDGQVVPASSTPTA